MKNPVNHLNAEKTEPVCDFTSDFLIKITITSPSADMVRLYVNFQFQVKPLSTGTSSSRTKKNSPKMLYGPPKVCAKFGVSSTSLS